MKDKKKIEGINWRKIVKIALLSFIGLLLLIIAGSAIFFFASFKHYVSKEEGFSIYYPRSWTMNENPMEGVIAAFVANKQNPLDFFHDNMTITYTDISKNPLSLDQYVEIAKDQLTTVIQDFTVTESEPLKISGRPGHKMVFQGKQDVNLTFVVYVFLFNDVAYNITYAAMTEHYEKSGRALLEMIIATLQVAF